MFLLSRWGTNPHLERRILAENTTISSISGFFSATLLSSYMDCHRSVIYAPVRKFHHNSLVEVVFDVPGSATLRAITDEKDRFGNLGDRVKLRTYPTLITVSVLI